MTSFVRTKLMSTHFALAFWMFLILSGVAGATTSQPTAASDPKQVWQLLDYVAVDYPNAVQGKVVVSAGEYSEMREFAAAARSQIQTLPLTSQRAALLAKADALNALIGQTGAPEQVMPLARSLASDLLVAYPVPLAPTTTPDLARGAQLYATNCASCHGLSGAGDGPAAQALTPPPIAFTDHERARHRSPFALYQVLGNGIAGTSMPGFSALPDADRWALAFHASGLSYSPADVAQGEKAWATESTAHAAIPDLTALSQISEGDLATKVGADQARTWLAYARHHPSVVAFNVGSLAVARDRLQESLTAYRRGDAASAGRLALASYLDGFEPIEPVLAAHNASLLARVEEVMGTYRATMARGAPVDEVADQAALIGQLYDETEATIAPSESDGATMFLGSFTILLREGVEALLIVVAIIAFLRKAERKELLPYVHAGWVGALLAGVGTWAVATRLIEISGASREMTEGVSSVFAAVVLLGVGLWMHNKSLAGRWQLYLNEKLSGALTTRSAWFLGSLSFIAVYREVFETILFYAALWSQGHHGAIAFGLVAASVALAAIAWLLLSASRRLPIAQFFSVSSLLVAVLAFVLIGKGIHGLQEAGVVGLSLLSVPRVDWLAIYPNLQSVLAQCAVVLVAAAGIAYNHLSGRRLKPSQTRS